MSRASTVRLRRAVAPTGCIASSGISAAYPPAPFFIFHVDLKSSDTISRWVAGRAPPGCPTSPRRGGRRARQSFTYRAFVPDPLAPEALRFDAATAADLAEAEAAIAVA